jgi:hypothetical protein
VSPFGAAERRFGSRLNSSAKDDENLTRP